jgi:hypothetical protein
MHGFAHCSALLFCHSKHSFCPSEHSLRVMASQSEESIFGTASLVWIASVALRPRNDTSGLIPQSLTRPTPVIANTSEESSMDASLRCASFRMTEKKVVQRSA